MTFSSLSSAGRGGGGCKSFSRGKIRRSGPADGGDGGRGGDVIVIAKKGLQVGCLGGCVDG